MRGATSDECVRPVRKGEEVVVARAHHQSPLSSGEVDLIFALGDFSSQDLLYANAGTRFELVSLDDARNGDLLRRLFGPVPSAGGLVIEATTYLGHRRDQSIAEPGLNLLCFNFRFGALTLMVMPWELEGAILAVISVPS